ncbi:hypothetical protein [Corallococcus sp. 4LFB]|uniref:hypothetical protein n=1 Tax=Corallococcus sp. 4LFB TaxID=3383249 RepID=UPI003976FCA7
MNLDGLLRDKRIIVLCGAGGVGKTTTAAALGVAAAARGATCWCSPSTRPGGWRRPWG